MTNNDWYNWGYEQGVNNSRRWANGKNRHFKIGLKAGRQKYKENQLLHLLTGTHYVKAKSQYT